MASKKNRPSTEVNAGSMADIAFLLLIFFLVTTTMANDKGIAMLLPPKPDPNQPPPEVKENDRNIFKIQANSKDLLLVEDEPLTDVEELKPMIKEFILNFGRPSEDAMQVYNDLPAPMKSFVSAYGRKSTSSDGPDKAIVSFKADRGTSYELYITVLDEVNAAYNEVYGERIGKTAQEFLQLDQKDPEQKKLYDQARSGMPRAISIAEPTKIGG
ncbi:MULTISPECIES: biopolymer transporter ExbD [unclassified Imperialibacter]|uniref:ExbD/TolR family protein n=1 Tax=unclassified Imperialibacter TaxID=2629706 RepID=UPI00125B19B3|nr:MULTISPECIES: biopolymer transporter ExbD [unclassified Imperialibacter]CAD5278294.1 Biopolymer transport protein ExbD [Imperialibacter sp. 89]CAD5292457.1 Biopolymer transport protein ExbD [Imperialibacter sp. 75]VVS99771.1 Biopolymer transport protein ExbD [Imperialibacter sp. EC-SDR9]